MFEKTNKSPARPMTLDEPTPARTAPAPAPKPRPASLIAEGMCIQGDLAGEAELQIDGLVRGDIRVGKLCLGPWKQIRFCLNWKPEMWNKLEGLKVHSI